MQQNSISIILDSNLNNRTNSNTFVLNEWDLKNHDNIKNQGDSDFSEIFYMNNNDQTDNNWAILSSKASAHSDNDSDSGICSSSVSCNSGLSLKSNIVNLK